ncbi:bifunctional metallophosphatase/5'-nucleotidase [Hazenella coriacea]|uniref:2',3'-cyclic-nucleotide 2'-phosphodiesterase/3'-nucleotidase n=1 Tax=Hazenella coriacea TaxID=1179467 RepID=A0A4V2UUT5_9BACL|nr:5'-nucleotidase C-terminal domain-containing protein [Hazenella coriacea]TCS93117.1 2',3'-cyclic-nucleotide 2'-phosphodiesterase/3'-nucleotidase [Hazenella coriacea]
MIRKKFGLSALTLLLTISLTTSLTATNTVSAKEKEQKVTIMLTSDLHGYITPIQYTNNEPVDHGLAKVSTLIKQVRQQNPNALLLDNGDLIQGSPMEYYHARFDNKPIDPMILTMNALKYDSMTIGNHEYNYGQAVMEKAMNEAKFPWLSANTVWKGTNKVYTKPYQVFKMKNGLRVGVLGLTTKKIPNWEDPKNIAHLDFLDPVETAKKWVPHLKKKEKVDVVVIAYHGGLEHKKEADGTITPLPSHDGENQAYELATQVKDLDVILTGHMHIALPDVRVNGVLVTEPGKWGSHLSVVDLNVKKKKGKWMVTDKKAQLLSVEGVPADPKVLKLIQNYETKTQAFLDQPVGKISEDLSVTNHHYVRTHDTALIQFINKVQMEASGATISSTSLFDNTVTGLPENVTTRDILSTYIYPNTLKVIQVKGSDIKAALEQTAKYFKQNNGQEPVEVNPLYLSPKVQHYNYDMWEGVQYTIDVSKSEGQRIVELNDLNGQPLDLNKEYNIVLNNYRAGGGGNYPMFAGKPVLKDINIEVSELMTNYIGEQGTVQAEVDHNWKIIGGLVE